MPTLVTENCQWITPISLKFSVSPQEKNQSENLSADAVENVQS